jgi:two-component system, chemotaxis family, chemotaxis protein CheY
MDMQADTDMGLKLPAVLDLAAADALLETMRNRLVPHVPFRLDASDVESITLPCMQVILAARANNDLMTIENPSEAFVSAFADLGLSWGDVPAREMAQSMPVETTESAFEPTADQNELAPDLPIHEPPMTKRILTIDDSKTIRDMLKFTLVDAGFEVLQAVDGQDGVEVFAKEPVDLVITDINMPKMDGYGVIRHIRGKSGDKSTPILVLTTESEVEKRNIAREAGATGWMVKPFDPEQMVATINKVVR